MKDRLSGITAVVDDHSISTVIKTALFSECLCNEKQMPDKLSVHMFDAMDIPYMFFGHDQDMDRRLWVDILECNGVLIFVDQLGGHRLFDDLAEDAV